MAIYSAGFYAFEMWRITYPYENPCDRLWTTPAIFVSRAILAILSNGVSSSLVVLCIERLVCMCRISNYEQSARPVLVSVFLLGITIVSSIVFVLLYSAGVSWSEPTAVTTVRNSKNGITYQLMLIYLQAIQLLGFCFFLFIRYWCLWYRKRLRSVKLKQNYSIAAQQSLSIKFQIGETIQMTNLFLPIVLQRCGFYLAGTLMTSISNAIWPHSSADTQMIIYELCALSGLAPIATCLLLAYGTGELKRLFCCSAQNKTTVIVGFHEDQDEHFTRLKQMFEGGIQK
ncbi:serpentine type 7TM GPCR receptor class ab chemoreceptor domain-containing protein [Ditylenchus destructor]|nr:serpentine type 7TM GPCR receptor class ab chemoreceptor domain-containing protein [Ditylenchus destructor]